MKRGTPDHPKTKSVRRALSIPLPHAVGLLELLWHFVGKYAPQGDVGRFSDEEIAEAVGWDGDASTFVAALVDARYLEKHDVHRLLVHDFHDHAENTVKRYLTRNGLEFLSKPVRDMSRRRPDMSRQSRDMSSLARGRGRGSGRGSLASSLEGESEGKPEAPAFAEFWAAYPRKEGKVAAQKAWAKLKPTASTLAAMLAALAWQKLSESWRKDEGQFIPQPASYLAGGRWLDEPPLVAPVGPTLLEIAARARAERLAKAEVRT